MTFSKYLNPANYVSKAYRLSYAALAFDAAEVERDEAQKFRQAGLDPQAALVTLNHALRQTLGRDFDPLHDSIHWLLFAGLSTAAPAAKRILEIGTYDGEFTAILARLFPAAEIVTVDLPADDPLLRSLYDRGDDKAYRAYREKQQANIRPPNVTAVLVNSFFLLDRVTGPFDLVWVDGGHLYPDVAWDLANAHHLCRPGGALLCDDVLPYERPYRDAYVSTESFDALRYIAERTGKPLRLFLKRRHADYHAFRRLRKYVAMIERE